MFKKITKASRHICSLFAYITSLQHIIISNFFVMKYNLPTILLFSFLWNHSGICLLSFFFTLIYQQMYVRHPCLFVFSICEYSVIALLNNCPMHGEFPSDAWLKMNAREKIIFKGEINVFSTKIFENYY